MLKGIGASQGYGIGNAVVISDAKLEYNHVEFTTAQNEKERLQKAVDTFIKETRKLADDVKNSAGDIPSPSQIRKIVTTVGVVVRFIIL